MITRTELDRLMERPASDVPVVSLFLDLRGTADARRARDVFLARQRGALDELARAWPGVRRAALEAALDRAERWLAEEVRPDDHGAAVFAPAGGEGFDAFALPVPVENRLILAARPAVAPLLHAVQGHRRHTVALVDREHLRLLSVWMGRVQEQEEVRMDPYPAAHDVQGGGFAEQRYQRRKLEEARHFFTGFAGALAAFAGRTGADDVVLAGTDENVGRFRRFLPGELDARVAATAHVPVDAPAAEVLQRLHPVLQGLGDGDSRLLLARLRERASTGYHAATGLQPTLAALQTGRVEALLLADDAAVRGGRCTQCGFLFADERGACPYDGAPLENGVPVVEEALRMAHAQGARAHLVSGGEAREFAGAGALLRF
jgi:peptide subunit release factor 1 (eRF1)